MHLSSAFLLQKHASVKGPLFLNVYQEIKIFIAISPDAHQFLPRRFPPPHLLIKMLTTLGAYFAPISMLHRARKILI